MNVTGGHWAIEMALNRAFIRNIGTLLDVIKR